MEPQPAKAAGTARRYSAQHPTTLNMVKEALQAHDEKKGASVVAIKRFILAKYPTVDPIRLKYHLKQALSKGLSSGDLVRPRNSTAVGATGTFMLARKKPQQKLRKADPDPGQAPKPGQKGTTKAPQASVAGARQRGATKQQPTATKQQPTATKQPKAKPVDAQPRAAEKPKRERAKHPPSADQPQAHGSKSSGPPKAASHREAPRKGRSGHGKAQAAENAGSSDSDSSGNAGPKAPQKAPRGKRKVKVPKGAQQDAPKAQGSQDQAKKPRVTPGARQGKARVKKAAPMAADKKAP